MKAYLLPRESAWNLCSIKNKNKDSLGLGSDSDSGHVALIAKHKTLDTRNSRLRELLSSWRRSCCDLSGRLCWSV